MIVFNDLEHGYKIADAIPRILNPMADKVISRTAEDGRLLGGVIYEGMTSNNIFMHQAGFEKTWMSPDLLWVLFDYPFHQLDLGKVCGTIPSSKPELLEFNLRLGFSVECVIKDAYKDGDLIVLSMRREECRWLRIKPKSIKRGDTLQ
jgi:hypothetical protein